MDEEITEPTSLGTELRQAREKKGLSLRDISNRTKIREVYLQALEDDNYSLFPSRAYYVGFLRNYTNSVGLEVGSLLQKYNPTVNAINEIRILDRLAEQKPPKVKTKVISKTWIAIVLPIFVLAIITEIYVFRHYDLWAKVDLTRLRELPGKAKDSALAIYKKSTSKPTTSETPKIEEAPTIRNEPMNETKTNSGPAASNELPPENRSNIPPTSVEVEPKGDTIQLIGTAKGSCWVILKKFIVGENGEEALSEYINDMILRDGISKQWTLTNESEVIEIVIQKPQFIQIAFNQRPFQLPEEAVDPITLRLKKGNLAIIR